MKRRSHSGNGIKFVRMLESQHKRSAPSEGVPRKKHFPDVRMSGEHLCSELENLSFEVLIHGLDADSRRTNDDIAAADRQTLVLSADKRAAVELRCGDCAMQS